MSELKHEDIYLTRAWLEKHGWEPTNNIPLFQHNPEFIDADLCVIVDRKDYMVAKFHYMGEKAFEPSAMPDSFEVVGVNNYCDMLEYDHARLVMAAYVCNLTGFEQIDNALGGVYEMTMNKKKEDEDDGTREQMSPEMEALLSRKTEELDLTVRTLNLLKANGIDTIRDLCRLTATDWLKFRNSGKKSLTELDEFLTDHGLTWGMNV
jgi:hypothetical protein